MFKSLDEFSIVSHGFIISLLLGFNLLLEEFLLYERIIQLCVGIGEFLIIDKQLESI